MILSVTSFPTLFLLSLIFHTFSYQVLDQYTPSPKVEPKHEKIKIKILSKAPHEELFRKKIIEAKVGRHHGGAEPRQQRRLRELSWRELRQRLYAADAVRPGQDQEPGERECVNGDGTAADGRAVELFLWITFRW